MKQVVVGAGILGTSIAYYLQKRGVDVLLVDADFKGKATKAGAGIVCPWVSSRKDPDLYRLARAGAIYYPELVEELKQDSDLETGYQLCGALALGQDEEDLDRLYQEAVSKREETDFVGEVRKLNNEEAKEMFPPLQDDVSAVYVSGGARVDGQKLNEALLKGFQKHGGELLEEEISLASDDGEVYIETGRGNMAVKQVILAAGAWSKDLLAPIGVDLTLEPQRGQIAHVYTEQDTRDWPVVLPQTSHYMLAFEDSRVVFGATRETGSGFDYRLTAGGVHEVLHEGLTVAPGLRDATLGEVRIGFRPMGPDYKPLLGRVSDFDNLIVATGLGPSGLTIGPYVGKLIGQLALGEEVEVDLSYYDPLR
ncbi:NAD(P)/FAD-dependent oxidoreductase [Alkalibacillus aidingensis]|uniref:NAD(P)/FAD-dependent oxidoreductase n=1 Tax=Alkalibacillus aidingensis TaxID=2747607 RepID=UPI0016605C1A|nr:FAD-dependent oxidoreductase [Alkalibacillus aidingensis]